MHIALVRPGFGQRLRTVIMVACMVLSTALITLVSTTRHAHVANQPNH